MSWCGKIGVDGSEGCVISVERLDTDQIPIDILAVVLVEDVSDVIGLGFKFLDVESSTEYCFKSSNGAIKHLSLIHI